MNINNSARIQFASFLDFDLMVEKQLESKTLSSLIIIGTTFLSL